MYCKIFYIDIYKKKLNIFDFSFQDAEEKGEDYEQQKLLQQSAYELEMLNKRKKKKNPDIGFSGENLFPIHLVSSSVHILLKKLGKSLHI